MTGWVAVAFWPSGSRWGCGSKAWVPAMDGVCSAAERRRWPPAPFSSLRQGSDSSVAHEGRAVELSTVGGLSTGRRGTARDCRWWLLGWKSGAGGRASAASRSPGALVVVVGLGARGGELGLSGVLRRAEVELGRLGVVGAGRGDVGPGPLGVAGAGGEVHRRQRVVAAPGMAAGAWAADVGLGPLGVAAGRGWPAAGEGRGLRAGCGWADVGLGPLGAAVTLGAVSRRVWRLRAGGMCGG